MSTATDRETFGRPTGDAKVISKQARKIDQLRQTIDQLHERLAAVQASKTNKASQIARLKDYLTQNGICYKCGEKECDHD